MAAYAEATGANPPPNEIEAASPSGCCTVNALVAAYLSSSVFRSRSPETQRLRRGVLEHFREQHGDKRIFRIKPDGSREMLLKRDKIQQLVNEKAEKPHVQRHFLNTLRVMFNWAVGESKVPENPTDGVKREKIKSAGYKTWSDADIEQIEGVHPIGTRARLALALLLYTGQRRGDILKLGRQHIHDGYITIDQRKTEGTDEAHVVIPVHPRLQEVIDATPSGHLTFLTTVHGKPFEGEFGKWFHRMCTEAGLKGLSAHGLRKAAARILAEHAHASTHQISAITGHASLKEVERYTAAANRKRMATEAMKRWAEVCNNRE
jgi:integrase